MQDYREIDRIRKDWVAVRSLAKRLLELPHADWNDWEIDFLQHMARHKGPDPITTRQGEKLIELRDDAKYYSSVHGFSEIAGSPATTSVMKKTKNLSKT